MDDPRVEVGYNSASAIGQGYSSGSIRLRLSDVGKWLSEQTTDGKPVLITFIRVL